MTDQLQFNDLPPELDRQRPPDYLPKYNEQVTYWPPLVAAGVGVLVLVLLFGWLTRGHDPAAKDGASKKPRVSYRK